MHILHLWLCTFDLPLILKQLLQPTLPLPLFVHSSVGLITGGRAGWVPERWDQWNQHPLPWPALCAPEQLQRQAGQLQGQAGQLLSQAEQHQGQAELGKAAGQQCVLLCTGWGEEQPRTESSSGRAPAGAAGAVITHAGIISLADSNDSAAQRPKQRTSLSSVCFPSQMECE